MPPKGVVLVQTSLSASEGYEEGFADDFQVQPDRLFLDVLDVVVDPFLEVGFAAVALAHDLPQSRDAGADGEAGFAPGGAHLVFALGAGARADDGHLAEQDVPELGDFVDGELSHPAADPEDAGVVLELELWAVDFVFLAELLLDFVSVGDHGAELPAAEVAAGSALAYGAVKDRAAGGVDLDQQRDDRPEGEGDEQRAERADDVEGALGELEDAVAEAVEGRELGFEDLFELDG